MPTEFQYLPDIWAMNISKRWSLAPYTNRLAQLLGSCVFPQRFPGQHVKLPENETESVNITSRVVRFSEYHFGGHVTACSHFFCHMVCQVTIMSLVNGKGASNTKIKDFKDAVLWDGRGKERSSTFVSVASLLGVYSILSKHYTHTVSKPTFGGFKSRCRILCLCK